MSELRRKTKVSEQIYEATLERFNIDREYDDEEDEHIAWIETKLKQAFIAGAEQMRERAAKVAARYQARAVADHIDALPLDPKEAQDAE